MNGCVPQCASFFEVIDPSMEATHMEPSLVIPKAFIKQFRSYLSYMVTLEAPSWVMFKAHIEVDEKKHFRITFGWKELAKHLGIRSGNLVILELVYKAHFRVYVYDGDDRCEKNFDAMNSEESYTRVTSGEPSDNRMNIGTIITERERAHACVLCPNAENGKIMLLNQDIHLISKASTYSNVKNKTIEENKELEKNKATHTVKNDCMKMIASCHLPPKVQRDIKTHFTLKDLQQVYRSLHAQTQQAFENALSYSSSNPFTIRMMISSNVCHGFKLAIPKSFAVQHMNADPECVALIDASKRTWAVTFLGHKNDSPSLSGGWRHFVLDHKLKCGDICIFEKISTKALTAFNVHTFRVNKTDRQELLNKVPAMLSKVIARGFT
ncbi:hypothetical protein KP509_29G035400 [Ceratopteris richardii]|uniref:TF-B3 domain-containing protein n=1 Tax=Ceratopteris richardii TaxID=49495 RepID=A0A8T2R7S3_CERRI|nr:hypothetical protein KP509_29G035400 [Ceratopteris richardii]